MFRRDIRDHSRVFLPQHLTFKSHHWKSKKLHKKTINDVAQPHTSKEEPCSHNSCSVCRLPFVRRVPAVLECRYWLHSSASLVFKHRPHVSGSEWSASSSHRTSASGISYPAAEANPASCLASIGKHGNTEKYPKDLLQKLSYVYIYIICMYIHSKSFGATRKCSQPPVQRCAVVCDHSNRGWVKTRMLPAKKNGNDAWSDTPNQQK